MKVIILSAGRSNRFSPLSNILPKQLLCIKEHSPTLGTIFSVLNNIPDIDEIIMVVGYKKELIMKYSSLICHKKLTFITNEYYEKYNNWYSFNLALAYLNFDLSDTLVLDSDLILDLKIVNIFLSLKTFKDKNIIGCICNKYTKSTPLKFKSGKEWIINYDEESNKILSINDSSNCLIKSQYYMSSMTYFSSYESGLDYINVYEPKPNYFESKIITLLDNKSLKNINTECILIDSKNYSREYDSFDDLKNDNININYVITDTYDTLSNLRILL